MGRALFFAAHCPMFVVLTSLQDSHQSELPFAIGHLLHIAYRLDMRLDQVIELQSLGLL